MISKYIVVHGGSLEATVRHIWTRFFYSRFSRQVSGTFATRIILVLLGVVTTVVVSRMLGPEGRGFYSVAMTLVTIGVQFGNLGLHASNTYHVSRDPNSLSVLTGNTLLASFIFGGLVSLVAFGVFQVWMDWAPVHGPLLSAVLVWVPFGIAYLLLQNLLLGIQEIKSFNLIEIGIRVISILLILVLFFVGHVSAINVFLAGFFALLFGFTWVLAKIISKFRKRPKVSIGLFRKHLSYGFKAYLSAFFAFMVLRIDLLMVKGMLGAQQAGWYSIASTMADVAYMFPMVVGTMLFPKLSSMENDLKKWKVTRKVIIIVSCVMVPMLLIGVLAARFVVNLLFGSAFSPAAAAFAWLCPGIYLLSMNNLTMNYLASVGMPLMTVTAYFVATLLNVGLNFYFIPRFGINGASMTSVFSYGVVSVMSLFYIKARIRKVKE